MLPRRSRVSIGRRADVGPPVPGSVIRMERGRWQGKPGLYIEGVQTETVMAEERKDWIFVLDLAESMAETTVTQQKKIKTVTWTEQATRVHWPVLFILANMACFAGDDAFRGCSMYRFRFAGDRHEWGQQHHSTQHGKTHQV